jgi:hypothetical protein
MENPIIISEDEKEQLLSRNLTDPPKYAGGVLNLAVQYASSNHRSKIGHMTEIFEEFREENPDGSFDEWKEYYFDNHEGRERLDRAVEETYEMFQNIGEALEDVDHEIVRDYVHRLILHDKYDGGNAKEAIIEKIRAEIDEESFRVPAAAGAGDIHLHVGDVPVSIQPESHKREGISVTPSDAVVVYYERNEDGDLVADVGELNRKFSSYLG